MVYGDRNTAANTTQGAQKHRNALELALLISSIERVAICDIAGRFHLSLPMVAVLLVVRVLRRRIYIPVLATVLLTALMLLLLRILLASLGGLPSVLSMRLLGLLWLLLWEPLDHFLLVGCGALAHAVDAGEGHALVAAAVFAELADGDGRGVELRLAGCGR